MNARVAGTGMALFSLIDSTVSQIMDPESIIIAGHAINAVG